ncbi:MAG: hypothetical protein AAGA93_14885, partial [Actinomycetota bacterium]
LDDPKPAEPAPAVGFEDLDDPKPAEPAPAVGFEDLDDPKPAEPAPAVGFEDLDDPKPNRRKDDQEPDADEASTSDAAHEGDERGGEADAPVAAPVGFEDL